MGNRWLMAASSGVRKEIGIRENGEMRSQQWRFGDYPISLTPLSSCSRESLSKGEPTRKVSW